MVGTSHITPARDLAARLLRFLAADDQLESGHPVIDFDRAKAKRELRIGAHSILGHTQQDAFMKGRGE